MPEFIFIKIIFMSIAMTAGCLLVLLASRLLGKLLDKRELRLLWLIPLLLSLIPITGSFVGKPKEVTLQQAQEYVVSEDRTSVMTEQAAETAITMEPTEERTEVFTAEPQPKFRLPDFSYRKAAAVLYFLILLLLLVYGGIRSLLFRIRLKKLLIPLESELLPLCKEPAGVKRRVRLYAIEADCSPFVYGILSPKIVVPFGNLTEEILMHELIHIRHGDLAYLLLLRLVKTVHFFNPVIHLCADRIKKTVELACDEACSSRMSEEQRLLYSRRIVTLSAPAVSGAACLSENGRNIKERIDTIMKYRRKTKSGKLLAVILCIVLLLSQSVLAAAINGRVPVRSYAVNNAVDVHSVGYQDAENNFYSGTSGWQESRASLVNTLFYKGFSADLRVTFSGNIRNYREEKPVDYEITVVMDRFLKSFDDGRCWQGLFTVTMNGEVVFYRTKGYLNEIPGNYERGITRLFIEGEDATFSIAYMNFDLDTDSRINAEYEEQRAMMFEAKERRWYVGNKTARWEREDGRVETLSEEIGEHTSVNIAVNPDTGRFNCDAFLISDRYYVSCLPETKYTYDGDSITGRFLLVRNGNWKLDEFTATVTIVEDERILFRSEDGSITMRMEITGEREPIDYHTYQTFVSVGSGEEQEKFGQSCKYTTYARRLSDLPFTLTLNEDGKGITFRLKDGFEPEGWCYSYSSYIGENDVYNKYHSKYGSRVTQLEVSPSYGTHNLQFVSYQTQPHISTVSYDILFRVVNGEVIYHAANETTMVNPDYSGEEGFRLLKERVWILGEFEE